jgi:hypothetical protein
MILQKTKFKKANLVRKDAQRVADERNASQRRLHEKLMPVSKE